MRLRGLSIILAGWLFFNGCEKSVKMVDCVAVESGLIAFDQTGEIENVLNEINKLCVDLKPKKTENDSIGHEENLNTLIKRLNEDCNNTLNTELVTYATIKTNPVQSEIMIILNKNNKHYIVDIKTPENKILKASNIHK